ncbi:MAG: WD40/YVTN/BNR-like repeat-containing protein [Candidatus Anammoxibacter sp.]
MITILSRKYFNQFNNGVNLDQNPTDFTIFLLGFIGQKIKRITEIDIFWNSEASSLNKFSDAGGADTITRETGSWIDDGFVIGDDINIIELTGGFDEDNVIANVTDLVLTVSVSNLPGSFDSDSATVFGKTHLLGMNYFSNFIENTATVTYISKVDEISIRKWSVEFTDAEYVGGTEKTATASGTNESWKIGSDLVKIKNTQQPLSGNDYHQRFQITEIFTITPFFDTIDNLENGIKPEYLINDLSLRHVATFEALPTLLNPIIIHALDDAEEPFTFGNVGYYDEQFNGFTPVEFTLDSIIYSNPSNQSTIVVDETTGVTIKIDSLNNLFSASNTEFQLNIVFLNENIVTSKDIDTNFAYDTLFAVADGAGNVGVNGILSNVKGNIVSNQLVITADIDYTTTQQSLIDGGKYIISIATNDHTLAIDQSKLVNVLADLNSYTKDNDIPGLMGVDSSFFYEHPFDKGTQGTTDFIGWVEDGILLSADFFLDLSLDAVINSLNLKLVAFNSGTGNFFEIADIPFDFTTTIISNGIQEIDIDSIRGFQLAEDSQFNLVRIKKTVKAGDLQHYDLDVGIKLQWMDWINLPDADTVFFDNTKLENGLNRLISNYSAENGYEIVIFIDAEVSNGVVNTNYRFISPNIRVFQYDTDDTGDPSTVWSGEVETFDQSSNDLKGNISGTENTDVKITFTALSGTISEAVLYAIIRIEEFQQGGVLNIWELSSFRDRGDEDNPLIPLSGQIKTIFTTLTSSVEVECSIDFSKLNTLSSYKITGRLGTACEESTGCAWKSQVSGTTSPLRSIFFIDSNIAWTCGFNGTILKTTDGGVNWTAQTSGTTTGLFSIFFVDSNTGWVSGNEETILKTTDGGTNWTAQTVGIFGVIQSIFFVDSNNGWAAGGSETILKTTDGGTNWTEQTLGVDPLALFSIFFLDSNTGWTCGFRGIILKTTDGGTNWTEQMPGVEFFNLFSIFFIDSNTGWASGSNGTILKTTDGGVNWTAQTSGTNQTLTSIFFFDSNNGWISGTGGIILNTTDGGTTWVVQTSGTTNGLFSIFFTDLVNGWTCGNNGTILRYICTTGGCDILITSKLKEDGTKKFTEDDDLKLLE